MPSISTIRAEDLKICDSSQGIILDVRTHMEHNEKCLSCTHAHVPLDELKPKDFMMRHGLDRDATVYMLCRSGKRAAQAAEKFIAEGYHNIKVIDGGILACESCGHAVKGQNASGSCGGEAKAKGPIPLERQVRIVAGLITGTGAALALWVNPLFAIIPLFVGSGLVFSGITDRCGMALILTKAPWNRVNCQTKGGCCGGGSTSSSSTTSGSKTGQSCQ